jgi:thiol:disulfide interchange protein DsbG
MCMVVQYSGPPSGLLRYGVSPVMTLKAVCAALSRAARQKPLAAGLLGLCLAATPSLAAGPVAAPAATALWQRLERAAWIMQGAKPPAHLIYVITDADCPYCHELWLSLQPFYASGLQVRYVMVGIVSRDSPGKAAAILEAPNPSLALDQNEKNWARLADDLGGGIPALRRPKSTTLAALSSNEKLMSDLGVEGTPALIYRSADHSMHVAQSVSDPTKLRSILAVAAPP